MNHKLFAALLCAGVSLGAMSAHADEAGDLADLKSQMMQMQKEYAARMAALEKRLARAEADAKTARASAVTAAKTATTAQATAATAAVAADTATKSAVVAQSTAQTAAQSADSATQAAQQAVASAAPPPPPPSSNNSFNPGIAAVLNGFYFASTRDPATQRIAGIALGDEAGLPARGFSLGESEISFAANIDPFMSGFLDISFQDDNSPEVEEAYIQSKDLPWGLTAKAGRFLSGIGYINERHAHDWSFSDAALPYRAFLNNQYGDDGAQLRWLAPTNQFLEFGAEIFRGDAYPSAGATSKGAGTYTAFVHTGNDINDSSSYLAAVSYLHSDASGRVTDSPAGPDIFTGKTDLGILSAVYKWAPGGNPTSQNLSLVGEGFLDHQSGVFNLTPVNQTRTGFHVQADYQFMPQWSLGLRYAALDTAKVPLALAGSALDDFGHAANAETALVEFDTSEFGRFRMQYTHDESSFKPNDEVLFQYTVIYGPHGAHRY
jgi:hypothetical protein